MEVNISGVWTWVLMKYDNIGCFVLMYFMLVSFKACDNKYYTKIKRRGGQVFFLTYF